MVTKKDIIEILAETRRGISDEKALKFTDMFPQWETMIGVEITQDMIDKGFDRYQYDGKLYKIIQPHTPQENWTPDTVPALYLLISLEEFPQWRQPIGSHDAYSNGAKVSHNGKKWISTIDNNTYEPGVYGWNEFIEETV